MFRRSGRTLAVLAGAALSTVLVAVPAHAEAKSLSAVLSCNPVPNTYVYWASGSTTYQFEKVYYRNTLRVGNGSGWDRVSKVEVSDIFKYFDTPTTSGSGPNGAFVQYTVAAYANATTNTPYRTATATCTL